MNALIDAIYRDKTFPGPDGEAVSPFPSAIKRNEGEALYHLVRAVKPGATLEVGTAFGVSTLFLCQALRDNEKGRHTAIDPFQSHFKYLGLHNVKQAGLGDLLTFIEEPSQVALARLVSEKKAFDVIFIDGAHVFDAVLVDFFFADQLLPVGGLLIFDDLWMPAVRKVLNFILTNRAYEIAEEFLGEKPAFVQRHLQNLKYQARKRWRGKGNMGTPSEMFFHRGHNVNWCVLRKTGPDERAWDHFAAF
jgi:predicted O-methyltransferase YrrM